MTKADANGSGDKGIALTCRSRPSKTRAAFGLGGERMAIEVTDILFDNMASAVDEVHRGQMSQLLELDFHQPYTAERTVGGILLYRWFDRRFGNIGGFDIHSTNGNAEIRWINPSFVTPDMSKPNWMETKQELEAQRQEAHDQTKKFFIPWLQHALARIKRAQKLLQSVINEAAEPSPKLKLYGGLGTIELWVTRTAAEMKKQYNDTIFTIQVGVANAIIRIIPPGRVTIPNAVDPNHTFIFPMEGIGTIEIERLTLDRMDAWLATLHPDPTQHLEFYKWWNILRERFEFAGLFDEANRPTTAIAALAPPILTAHMASAPAPSPEPSQPSPPRPEPSQIAQEDNMANGKSKRGPRRYSKAEKIAAYKEWKGLDRDVTAISLEEWLDKKFGNNDGVLKVSRSTFYSWKNLE